MISKVEEQKEASVKEETLDSVPAIYRDSIAENLAVRKSVGIIDLSYRGYLKVSGPDRASFLQGIITNDVSNLKVGEGLHAALLTVKGHVLADFILLAFEDHVLLETETSVKEKLRAMLSRYKIREKVAIEEVQDLTPIGVQGPLSRVLIEGITGTPIPELKTFHYTTVQIVQNPILLRNQSVTGEGGFILTIPKSLLEVVSEHLQSDGSELGLRQIGSEAAESLRIEAGIPRYGFDITEENIPLEIDDLDMISFTKGCYVGQEVIARLKFLGQANKHLRGLRITDAEKPPHNARITRDEREVGRVTSGTYSPSLKQNIAMAYLRRESASSGTGVMVEINGENSPATVADLPFIKR